MHPGELFQIKYTRDSSVVKCTVFQNWNLQEVGFVYLIISFCCLNLTTFQLRNTHILCNTGFKLIVLFYFPMCMDRRGQSLGSDKRVFHMSYVCQSNSAIQYISISLKITKCNPVTEFWCVFDEHSFQSHCLFPCRGTWVTWSSHSLRSTLVLK